MDRNPLTSTIRKFIRSVKARSIQLKRSAGPDLFHFKVFSKCTRAIVMQFRHPNLSVIIFLTSPRSKSVKVQLAVDMRLSDLLARLPIVLENCEPLTFKAVFGGPISLRDLLEDEARRLLQTAIANAVFSHTGFEYYPPENVAIYRYPGLVINMNVEAVIKRELVLALADRANPSPPQTFFTATNRKRTIFAARFREIW
jgi:hypothetical protein